MVNFSEPLAGTCLPWYLTCSNPPLGSLTVAHKPGFIETEMTDVLDAKTVQGWRDSIPLKRGGHVNDVANLAVFLASDMSSYITGQTINVCGGMLT